MPSVGKPIRETKYTYIIVAIFLAALGYGVVHIQNRSEKTGVVIFYLPKGSTVVNENTGKRLSIFLGGKTLQKGDSKESAFAATLPFGEYGFVVRLPSGEEHTVGAEVKSKAMIFSLMGGEIRRLH